jgi:hypothetical protein
MSVVTESLSPKDKARFLEAARLAGLWYLHNQNAPGRGWGGVDQSADTGRFLYEYYPATGRCRGCGVWSQALASCVLLALSEAPVEEKTRWREAAELGLGYLKSLQVSDGRLPKSYGGFREHTPQTPWNFPRDGATGCFGLATFARKTGDADALERADLWCKWYSTHGSFEDKWPFDMFKHDVGEGSCKVRGDWQAGGALCYYYTAAAAGNDAWLKDGFRPVLDVLLEIGNPGEVDGAAEGWHGESRITVGNDDFATVALLAGFLAFEDERCLELARRRTGYYLSLQDEDGSFPNLGGTFVTAMTLLDFVEVARLKGLPDDVGPMIDALLRAARRGLELQCLDHRDRRAYGGVFGQSNYGVSRDRVHNRSTSYGAHLWLRLAGYDAPCLSAVGW